MIAHQQDGSTIACPSCRAVFRQAFERCPLDGAVLTPMSHDPLLGLVVADRYVIEKCIGAGGMGRVYRAKHQRMSRLYAVKVLYGDIAADAKTRTRFAREAEIVSRLNHKNIVAITDFGETPARLLYIVMDFVEGPSLHSLVARNGPIAPERAIGLIRQMALGLEHAHHKGLIHRDFKSENVLITRDNDGEFARILDFGLAQMLGDEWDAQLTTQGMVMGTPAFMAPEQATGGEVDPRVDMWALGVVLYQMLSASLPFFGQPMQLMQQILNNPPPPLRSRRPDLIVDPHVEGIMLKLMAKPPQQRYQSARELISHIDALWGPAWGSSAAVPAASVRARAASVAGYGAPTQPTNRRAMWIAGLLAAGLGIVIALLLVFSSDQSTGAASADDGDEPAPVAAAAPASDAAVAPADEPDPPVAAAASDAAPDDVSADAAAPAVSDSPRKKRPRRPRAKLPENFKAIPKKDFEAKYNALKSRLKALEDRYGADPEVTRLRKQFNKIRFKRVVNDDLRRTKAYSDVDKLSRDLTRVRRTLGRKSRER